jgi:hypothetical protein
MADSVDPTVSNIVIEDHNLQALVELQYIRVGNEVMNSALTKLEQALTITQGSLDVLSSLQNLHNQLAITAQSQLPFNFSAGTQTVTIATGSNTTVTQPTTFTTTTTAFLTLFPCTVTLTQASTRQSLSSIRTIVVNNADSYMAAYQALASVYYGQPIAPIFKVDMPASGSFPAINAVITSSTQPEFQQYVARITATKSAISGLISQLELITNAADGTTLLSKLKTVYNDLNAVDLTNFDSVRKWVIDNYDTTQGDQIVNRGNIQQNITNAITAAQSSNTSQNEAVRRYMFVFEQYCQSAAAIINKLDQLFQKISRGIAG